jgi:RHS repeat-associated protein
MTDYAYDSANRLTHADAANYSWDKNGNLLSDGINTYTYNSANQLTGFDGQGLHASFAYDGLGDRLQQTIGGVPINYAVDINSALPQVLQDGTDSYIYGVGNLSQINGSNTDYFLTDALGSTRQLVNAADQLTLAENYDPFGNTIASMGSDSSIFGFTGQQTDSSSLQYLRARYYNPATAEFITRDTWSGDSNNPLSLNHWAYTDDNPVNRTDRSGRCWYIDAQGSTQINPLESPINGPCPEFRNVINQNGGNLPGNADPSDWLKYLPPDLRVYFEGCPASSGPSWNEGTDFWMVIEYATSSQWKYYQESGTSFQADLVLGWGGGGGLSCESSTGACQASGDIDAGVGFLKFDLDVGLEGTWDYNTTGDVSIGAHVGAGPCDLYVNFTQISTSCNQPGIGLYGEIGWKRDPSREYWVLTDWFTVGHGGYIDFAKNYVIPPEYYHDSTINYYVIAQNPDKNVLEAHYSIICQELGYSLMVIP